MASLFQSGLGVTVALAVPLLIVHLASRAFLLRRLSEFERQLLELLHLATARGQSLPEVFARAAREARKLERRWLERIGQALEAGAPLAEALVQVHRGFSSQACFAPHVLAAIAAADGTAQLPIVLADLARRQDYARELRYRVLMAASYPTLLSLLLVVLGGFWWFASWGAEFTGLERADLWPWAVTIAVACSSLWLLLAFGWGNGPWSRWVAKTANRLPWLGRRLQLLPAARTLQAVSSLVASGASLASALRQAANVSGDARLRTGCARAAGLAEAGAVPDEIWRATALPEFATARAAASRSSHTELARTLAELGDRCHERCADSIQRSISVMQPVVVLGFGLIVALQFSQIFGWLEFCRGMAMEQMPW